MIQNKVQLNNLIEKHESLQKVAGLSLRSQCKLDGTKVTQRTVNQSLPVLPTDETIIVGIWCLSGLETLVKSFA